MLRLSENQSYKIETKSQEIEGRLFEIENTIGEFIDDYYSTPHDEKDDVSETTLKHLEELYDVVQKIYESTDEIATLLEAIGQLED